MPCWHCRIFSILSVHSSHVALVKMYSVVVAPVLGHGAGVVYVLPEPASAPLALGVSR